VQRAYEVMGRRLEIHLGDITALEVGAIVSSENSDLVMDVPGGPSVSGAIRRVEGDDLAHELARMGPIEPGRAVVTPARHLPCRWVIHAATVIKTEGGHRSTLEILRQAVRSALQLAAGLGVESVAFPAFGVRAAEVPRGQSSQIMVEEIVSALRERTSLRRVVVALLDPESFLSFFEEAMQRGAEANRPLELRVDRTADGLAWSPVAGGPIAHAEQVEATAGALQEVAGAVATLRSSAGRRLRDAEAELAALGARVQALVPERVRELLAAGPEPLVLRLDEALAGVPFELARDGDRFLVERRPVSRALVTRQAGSTRAAEPRPAPASRPLLRALFLAGAAEGLPDAVTEAGELGSLYWRRAPLRARSTLLAGSRATRAAVLRELPDQDLIHWCGHTPTEGAWALGAGGTLAPADLRGLALRARLVVSNSCGPEQATAWARAFLLAGAQNVVHTLWEVGDAAARAFAVSLHEHLLLGRSLGSALQTAREHLRERDPIHWAAYQHYGQPGERLFEAFGRGG
jgi:O-acetyl-ADP-ribose deacetylase (regulator of RNase III)